jgi:hypothetical protein
MKSDIPHNGDGPEDSSPGSTDEYPDAADSAELDPPNPYSDLTLAARLVTEQGEDLVHIEPEGSWYIYSENEGRWMRDDKMYIFTLTKRLIVTAAHEHFDEVNHAVLQDGKDNSEARSRAKKASNPISTAAKVAAVEKLARSDVRVAFTSEIFDRDPWLLNTPAGAVDLRNGKIRPARREDYFTKVTPVAPRRMPTPIFDTFLREILGLCLLPDACPCAACKIRVGKPLPERLAMHVKEVERLVQYMLRVYGYCLSGECA